ncbi:MAG TPA: M56 family metallopeptidase [Thermoanaerobaculia bacterium]|nr:M56 family metallopeptidase [Thermoanaerobaculia bacterium]
MTTTRLLDTDVLPLLDPSRSAAVLPVLLQLALGAALLVAITALGCRIARTASMRHLLWSAAMVSLLALPVLRVVVPTAAAIRLPAPLAVANGQGPAANTPATITERSHRQPAANTAAVVEAPRAAGPARAAHVLPDAAPSLPLDNDSAESDSAQSDSAESASLGVTGSSDLVTASPRPTSRRDATITLARLIALGWPVAFAALWLLGTVTLLLGLGRGLLRRRRLLRSSLPCFGPCSGPCSLPVSEIELDRWLESAGSTDRRPRLRLTDAIEIPITWGHLRPVVLLPMGATDWSAHRLRHVLLHELAHAHRADAAWNTLARLVRALYWPLPFVWWAESRLIAESELACDDHVVRAGVAPARYAQELIGFAREVGGRLPEPVAAMARRSGLHQRVQAVLDDRRDRSAPRVTTITAVLAISCGLVAPLVASVRIAAPGSLSVEELAEQELAGAFEASARSATIVAGEIASSSSGTSPVAAQGESSRGGSVEASLSRTYDDEDDEVLPGCGPLRSTQIQRRNDHYQYELEAEDCRFEIELDGELEIADDERSIARVGRGARMDYREEVGGTDRRLIVEAGGDSTPRYSFSVGGRNRDFDAEARTWLAERLPFLLRVTGWQAEERVGRILARSGVDGLFDEILLIPSDHVSRLYLTHGLEQADLDTTELRRWVELAAATIGSDFELAEALSQLPPEALDEPSIQTAFARAAETIGSDFELRRTLATLLAKSDLSPEVLDTILEAALTIGSDFEAAELIVALLRRYPAGHPIPDTFFEVAATIGSDFELRRSLDAFVQRGDVQSGHVAQDDRGRWADQLDAVLESASSIGSDFEAVELLIATARRYPEGRELPDVYFDIAKDVGSDFELHRALSAAFERDLSAEGLERLLRTARGIGSDFELAELLIRVERRYALEGNARSAFDDALATLSGHERRRVEESSRRSEAPQ